LAVRGGAKAMRNGAIGCAILLAVIEGVGIAIGRVMSEQQRWDAQPQPQIPGAPMGKAPTQAVAAV